MTNKKQDYVVGFRFDESKQQVVLIRKLKPKWQRGYLNGVGGKVESFDNTYPEAMVREFREEATLDTDPSDWDIFARIQFNGGTVYAYRSIGSLRGIKTNTDEVITIVPLSSLYKEDVLFNLNYLVFLALDGNLDDVVLLKYK